MQATVAVRRANLEDAAAIAAVLRDIAWFDHINGEPPDCTSNRVAEQLALCADHRQRTVLVAEDPEVAGYIATHWFPNLMKGMDGYISELFLRRAARGKGIGAALVDAVIQEGRRLGATRLMLFNRRERESYQRGFYPKHGWVERTDTAFFTLELAED